MSSATDINGDTMNSSLSVDSITIDLNETQVECQDGNGITIGSDDVCIVGKCYKEFHAFVRGSLGCTLYRTESNTRSDII